MWNRDGGMNGFSITGGVLNYTAEVVYPETGDRLSIVFQFKVNFTIHSIIFAFLLN